VALGSLPEIDALQVEQSRSNEIETTALTFVLTQPVKYRYFTLSNPNRLVVDINDAMLKADVAKVPLDNTVIKSIRAGQTGKQVRLVFDLKQKTDTQITLLAPKSNYRDRLLIVLTSKNAAITSKQIPEKKTLNTSKNSLLLKAAPERDIVVVIDPGHGGKDPGAVGSYGAREKEIVLGISQALYHLMKNEPGLKPVLTRSGDYFIGLRGRLQKARNAKADMFIAIHADAYKNRSARGASVYALSQRGASSEAARWLAQKENYSELGGVDLNGLEDSDKNLRSVLIDLSQTATIAESLDIGESLLSHLSHINSLHHETVEQARFVVLKSPDIPSVLVETGFISNPSEEHNLQNPAYREQIAKAILTGIKQYFVDNPPRGTLYAAQKDEQQAQLAHRTQELPYRIKKGDTLSLLADEYHISVEAIRKRNGIHNGDINVGQTIILPAIA
jgi:N-acetylmuramoyl-L-alanine amidase